MPPIFLLYIYKILRLRVLTHDPICTAYFINLSRKSLSPYVYVVKTLPRQGILAQQLNNFWARRVCTVRAVLRKVDDYFFLELLVMFNVNRGV
jgi:hypothetical protein